jgi:nicotinate-nucleotide pyrophosphorylase (carboxylating)
MKNTPNLAQIRAFIEEDVGSGDVTANLINKDQRATAKVITREPMVLCGKAWFDAVFHLLNPEVEIHWLFCEGDVLAETTVLCTLQGNARALLTGERTALNLLQTLSATATQSRHYAEAVVNSNCQVLDTRKTIPGLRHAQKYAVQCGGCFNHRIGLYDAVLIKENHIIAAGSIENAVKQSRAQTTLLVEVEVESMEEFSQALQAKPDRIMLDNFSVALLKKAVALNNSALKLEASGDINLGNIAEIAQTGVDYISIGSLTKHVNAINLSMRIEFTV